MSTITALKPSIKLYHAEVLATRYLSLITPYLMKWEICGSIRRRKPECGDIELVVVSKSKLISNDLFGEKKPISLLEEFYKTPGKEKGNIILGGERYKKIHLPFAGTEFEECYPFGSVYQVDLFITNLADYGRQIAIRTGSSLYTKARIAGGWYQMGWRGTPDGLRRREQMVEIRKNVWEMKPGIAEDAIIKPPMFPDERSFYHFIGEPWVDPSKRNWEVQDK